MSSEESPEEQMRFVRAKDDTPGGRWGTLASSESDKQRAVRYMEEHLLPDTQAAGRMAEGGGKLVPQFLGPQAPGVSMLKPDTGLEGLSGWATKAALADVMPVWQGQVQRLVERLRGEMKAIGGTKTSLHNRDITEGQGISTAARLSPTDTGTPPLRSNLDQY